MSFFSPDYRLEPVMPPSDLVITPTYYPRSHLGNDGCPVSISDTSQKELYWEKWTNAPDGKDYYASAGKWDRGDYSSVGYGLYVPVLHGRMLFRIMDFMGKATLCSRLQSILESKRRNCLEVHENMHWARFLNAVNNGNLLVASLTGFH